MPEFVRAIKPSCVKMSSESGKALRALALAIKTMKHPTPANQHVEESKAAVEDLKTALDQSSTSAYNIKDTDLLAIVPAATMASILVEIVKCVEEISESVHELSQLAHFSMKVEPTVSPEKQPQHLLHRGSVNPVLGGDDDFVIVTVVNDDQTAGRDTPEIIENIPPQAPKGEVV